MRATILLMAIFTLWACNKDQIENPDCEKLQVGIIDQDESLIKDEIEKLTEDLEPRPNLEDAFGHKNNLDKLVERLNDKCNTLEASVECYACLVTTFPAISEIKVVFTYNSVNYAAIIELFTPAEDILRYAGMHYYIDGEE